jgi:hypothetical protein
MELREGVVKKTKYRLQTGQTLSLLNLVAMMFTVFSAMFPFLWATVVIVLFYRVTEQLFLAHL